MHPVKQLVLVMLPVAGSLALFLHGVPTQGPSFNTKMELRGSATFVHANWHVDGTTGFLPPRARARMENGGLTLGLDADEPSTPAIQFRRQFIVGDGVIWAWFRIRINDVDEVGFWLGLYSRDANPTSGDPDDIAAFHKHESDTAVDLRTRNGSGSHTEADKFTMSNETSYDLVIKLDPTTASNSATFWWRESGAASWSSQTVTTNVPADTATLHFSLCAFNADLNPPDGLTLVAEVFEAEAETSETNVPLAPSAQRLRQHPPDGVVEASPRWPLSPSGERPLSSDPPFSSQARLVGSTEFNYDVSDPNASDWDVSVTGAPGEVALNKLGLYLFPGQAAGGAVAVAQHRMRFTPASGVNAWARFRVRVDHGDEHPSLFGFYSTDTDPFSGDPDVIAAFATDPDGGGVDEFALVAVTKKAGQTAERVDLMSAVSKDAVVDCVLQVEGTTKVRYWYKLATETQWGTYEHTALNQPDGPMRFSAAMSETSTNGSLRLYVFEFEIER